MAEATVGLKSSVFNRLYLLYSLEPKIIRAKIVVIFDFSIMYFCQRLSLTNSGNTKNDNL